MKRIADAMARAERSTEGGDQIDWQTAF